MHIHAYPYIAASRGLVESESFKTYSKSRSICDKNDFLLPLIEAIRGLHLHTGDVSEVV